MTKKPKLLERVRNSPKDAKFSEVQKLLKDAGFRERQPRGGSSHYIYCHELLDRIVTLAVGVSVLLLRQFGSVMILFLLVAYFGAFIVVSATIRRNLATSV